MMLKDGQLLFHGSYVPVEHIDLDQCAPEKDFGKGFYTTTNPAQARNFIRSSLTKAQNYGKAPLSQHFGFVTSYRFHQPLSPLKVFEFPEADREWLWFVSMNRRNRLAGRLAAHVDRNIIQSDIIIGKVANDTTNPVITTYLNGLYGDLMSDRAVNTTIENLLPDHLNDQICFLTERAVQCLEVQEVREYVV